MTDITSASGPPDGRTARPSRRRYRHVSLGAWYYDARLLTASRALGLAIFVCAATFSDIWIGPFPAWLILDGFGILLMAMSDAMLRSFLYVVQKLWQPVVLPWLAFEAYSLIDDAFHDSLDFERTFALQTLQLLCLLIVAGLALRTPPRQVAITIGALGTIEGLVCIGQIAQNRIAWQIPAIISKLSSHVDDVDSENSVLQIFRVRGTVPMIAKFNPMQGMLAAFLAVLSAYPEIVRERLRLWSTAAQAAMFLSVAGVLLTFSRSTWLSLGLIFVALSASFLKSFSARRLIAVALLIGAVAVLASFSDLAALARIFGDAASASNETRIHQYSYAVQVLQTSPIFGQPEHLAPGEQPIHSVLIAKFARYGIVGMSLYAAAIFGLLGTFLNRAWSADDMLKLIARAGLAMAAVAIVDSWTHSSGFLATDATEAPFLGVLLGLMLGREAQMTLAGRGIAAPHGWSGK